MHICLSEFTALLRYDLLLSSDDNQRAAARKLDLLGQCDEPILALLRRQCELTRDLRGDRKLVVKRCSDLMEIARVKFYAFPFKDVPICWVELFREASLLKFTAIAVEHIWGKENEVVIDCPPPLSESQIDEMVQTIDMALILSGPPRDPIKRESVAVVMDYLQKCHVESRKLSAHEGESLAKRQKLENPKFSSSNSFTSSPGGAATEPYICRSNSISREHNLSVKAFAKHMQKPSNPDIGPEPVIITGALEGWPALENGGWSDPEYLLAKTIGGRRLVPIETGKSYVDSGFGQKIVKFKDFMDQCILHPNDSTEQGYLAQHDLFSQIPSLRNDVIIPDYCYTIPPGPHPSSPFAEAHSKHAALEEPLLNAWFGPKGTTTPLHTDPYHNILAQVVGRKYIRMYAPRESKKLYAKGIEDGIDMSNTSEVDFGILAGLDGTRHEALAAGIKFPLTKTADFMECILEPGECLYIPIGWWHYVRSLSVSFSVSFWFN